MIRLALLLALALARGAAAQSTTTHLVWPSYGGTDFRYWTAVKNELWCWRLPTPHGITNATKLALGFNSRGPAGCVAGVGIYDDDDAGARRAVSAHDCTTSGVKGTTGIAAFSLVEAAVYRVCTCITYSGSPGATTTPSFTSIFDRGEDFGGVGFSKALSLNANSARIGIAANPCLSGVPPTTTGGITATDFWTRPGSGTVAAMPPVLVIEP